MIETNTLENIIRRYVSLSVPTSGGFCQVLCKVCNDHGRKGLRAGFKFDQGGYVGYNCFNCSHSALFDPNDGQHHFSKDMIMVLDSFGIPQNEYNTVLLAKLSQSTNKSTLQKKHVSSGPITIKIPKEFYLLEDADSSDKWAEVAKYTLEDRAIDWSVRPYYLCTAGKSAVCLRWHKRLIIPLYFNNNIVFYQGRDLTGRAEKKYLSCSVPSSNVLYGFEQLRDSSTKPLFVVEGFFDSEVINGVAVLGNNLSDYQIHVLNNCKRPKVVIPDRYGDGIKLAEQALKLEWSVSCPEIGNCKDVNAAVVRFGKLYVLNTIQENTKQGFAAKSALQFYCKKNENNKKTRHRKSPTKD